MVSDVASTTPTTDGPLAAVDLGSHSTRLLIANPDRTVIRRVNTVTKMGAGVGTAGAISPDAIDRVVDVLLLYQDQVSAVNGRFVSAIATAAARDASNTESLFGAAEKVLGIRPRLLDGQEEGRLSFLGATAGLSDTAATNGSAKPPFVVDIGGSSVEFVFQSDGKLEAISTPLGCQLLTEQYIQNDPAVGEDLYACLSLTESYLDDIQRSHPEVNKSMQLIGVGGTFTTAAAVEVGDGDYDGTGLHGFRLDREAAEDVFRTVAREDRAARLGNPGLGEDRVDVFVAGMCVLIRTMRSFDFEECVVSEADILDGVIAEIAQRRLR